MANYTEKNYSRPFIPSDSIQLGQGSLLKGILKEQKDSFIQVLGQLAEGEELELRGETISLKDNLLGATLALNKFLADEEAINLQLWKIFNFEDKLMDQVASAAA